MRKYEHDKIRDAFYLWMEDLYIRSHRSGFKIKCIKLTEVQNRILLQVFRFGEAIINQGHITTIYHPFGVTKVKVC